MAYHLSAAHIFCEDDDRMMVSFADDEFEPNKFVILRQACLNNDQDNDFGTDKIQVQVESWSRSHYGGIVAVNMETDNVSFFLNESAQFDLKVDGNIEIFFNADHPRAHVMLSTLEKMLKQGGVSFSKS